MWWLCVVLCVESVCHLFIHPFVTVFVLCAVCGLTVLLDVHGKVCTSVVYVWCNLADHD